MEPLDPKRADWEKLGIDIDLVKRLYLEEGKSCPEIAAVIGWSEETVRRLLKRAGIPRRRGIGSGAVRPERNHFYKRGWRISASGYKQVLRRDGKHRYAWEHRVVVEEHLGRKLTASEVVHYKNGDKLDNRIENLEVFQKNSDHLRHELTGRCPKWTEDGLRRIREGIEKSRIVRAESNRLKQIETDAARLRQQSQE